MSSPRSAFRLFVLILALGVGVLAFLRLPVGVPPAPPTGPGPLTGPVDRILVEKAARRLTVFRDGRALRSYPVALGFSPKGDKRRQGDGRTPEGLFHINHRNGESRFHLSLGLDYPQADDLQRARAGGYDPGGDIMIHGQPNSWAGKPAIAYDWTAGCVGLADRDIEELWRATSIGTKVEIRP